MKAVIFNADDFGASPNINRAIVRAHQDGVLTSASLMVNEPACAEAVRLGQENPDLGVGLHLVLSNGRPALSPSGIPAIVNRNGQFPNDPATAGLRIFFRSDARRQVRCEIAAQFESFRQTGLHWAHTDGHQHLHMHPVIWDALVEQCGRHSVSWVRIPNEEFQPATRQNLLGRRIEWAFFRMLRRRSLRSLRRAGISCADRVYGHLESGRMTEDYVVGLLSRMRGATNEIYFHPGAACVHTNATMPGDPELSALLSQTVRSEIERQGLLLTNYAALSLQATGR